MQLLIHSAKRREENRKPLTGVLLTWLLMYIWSDHLPVNTVIPSAHTSQIKMLVIGSGVQGLDQWQTVRRSLAEDYRHAFGVHPGPVIDVAIMADTGYTRTKATGEYADIIMECWETRAE